MTSPTRHDASAFDINADFAASMKILQLDPKDTGGSIVFGGQDPVLQSKHRLGAIMSLGMMAAAAATQILYKLRGGGDQDLSVDLRAAVAHINPLVAFEPLLGGYGYQLLFADPRLNPISFGIYLTKDGRWYLPTGAYPAAIPPWMGLLGCDFTAKAVGEAIAQWDAQDLEDEAAARGMIGSICRTPEEWLEHPQGALLAETPLIEINKIGDSEPELTPLRNAQRPLSGIKIASFTHVIAGQVVGRTMAEQGAEVLHLARPADYEYDALWADTAVGFRSAWMELTNKEYVAKARDIIKGADVVVENFRGTEDRRTRPVGANGGGDQARYHLHLHPRFWLDGPVVSARRIRHGRKLLFGLYRARRFGRCSEVASNRCLERLFGWISDRGRDTCRADTQGPVRWQLSRAILARTLFHVVFHFGPSRCGLRAGRTQKSGTQNHPAQGHHTGHGIRATSALGTRHHFFKNTWLLGDPGEKALAREGQRNWGGLTTSLRP